LLENFAISFNSSGLLSTSYLTQGIRTQFIECVVPESRLFRIWGRWPRRRHLGGPRSCCRCPQPLPGMQTASKHFRGWTRSGPEDWKISCWWLV